MRATELNRPRLHLMIALLSAMIILLHLGCALVGKSFFRANHLGTALEYSKGPINLLRPIMVGFNATGTPTPEELPIWQATVALVFKATGSTWWGWANLVSLLFFSTCLWPFYQIVHRCSGERVAWWACVFFLAQPLIVIMAGEAAVDGFCLAVTIWFVFFADTMIRTGKVWWWFPSTLFASLAAVTKLPFFMAAGLYTIFLLMLQNGKSWKLWALLAGTGAVAGFAFATWTHFTDSVLAQAQYPFVELRLSHSPSIVNWFFGDLHYRLSAGPWLKGGWRFLHATVGSLPLTSLLIAALIKKGNTLPKLWLVATFVTTLVFSHLVLAHWHYYLMCCPGVAFLCGATLSCWEDIWLRETPYLRLTLLLVGLALVFSTVEGIVAMKIGIDFDQFPREIASIIRQHTKPEDRLIIYTQSGIWGGEELFRSGRAGFYVHGLQSAPDEPTVKGLRELLGNEADLQRLKSLGYNRLVLISESPVRFASEAVNPGSKKSRLFYPSEISPSVDSWPTVYRSTDLLIKEIP